MVACIVFILGGCSSSSGRNTIGTLRVLNAVVDAEPLDVLVGNEVDSAAVAVGSTSGYVGIPVGAQNVKVRSSTNGTVLLDAPRVFGAGKQTIYLYGTKSNLSALVLTDETPSPSSGKAKVRALDLSPEAGTVDVYVTKTDVASSSPLFSGLMSGLLADFVEVDGGTATLAYTTTGTKDVLFQASGQNFAAGTNYTLVVFPSTSGQLVNAEILILGGSGTFLPNSLARVKGVNAMADATVVNFKADGATLFAGVAFAASTGYATLTAADHTMQIEGANVPGFTIASVKQTFAPARDYSAVAVGTASAPGIVVFADENYVPASGMARVRFVNALSGSGIVDVLVNSTAQTTGLAPRTASAYYSLAPSTSYTITFSTPGGAGVIATLSGVEIAAGNVYTAYVLGNPAAATAILVRDR